MSSMDVSWMPDVQYAICDVLSLQRVAQGNVILENFDSFDLPSSRFNLSRFLRREHRYRPQRYDHSSGPTSGRVIKYPWLWGDNIRSSTTRFCVLQSEHSIWIICPWAIANSNTPCEVK